MSELKRCPFCGGEAGIDSDKIGKGKSLYYAYCKNDCITQYGYYSSKESAITAWNTRKPMERIMERLKEEPYINKGGELFLNGYNEDCLPLRKVFEIVKEEGGIE